MVERVVENFSTIGFVIDALSDGGFDPRSNFRWQCRKPMVEMVVEKFSTIGFGGGLKTPIGFENRWWKRWWKVG